MRLFIAINLPVEERRAIHEATAPVRESARAARWVHEELLHVTMKFLGERSESDIAPLRVALEDVAMRHRAFAVEIDGVGAFPNWRSPRIVWMGVPESPALELLFHDVESACGALGYAVEGRPFRPHITIGRLRTIPRPADARSLASAARRVRFAGAVEVRSVDLMASEQTPAGPRYSAIAAPSLRSN